MDAKKTMYFKREIGIIQATESTKLPTPYHPLDLPKL